MRGKFTIECVKKIFEEGGCVLLSKKYINARTPMKYRCECGIRGNGTLNAHHLYSYNKYKSLRYEKLNGITLCEGCHKDFHNSYGYGDNTIFEWIEWFIERVGIKRGYNKRNE